MAAARSGTVALAAAAAARSAVAALLTGAGLAGGLLFYRSAERTLADVI